MTQTTTLIATSRNEGPFILEWIAYHKAIGFDHILVYMAPDCDGSSDLLTALGSAGVVTYIDHTALTANAAQGWRNHAYTHALSHPMVQGADWVMALDMDEFLNIHTGDGTLDALFGSMGPADVISIPWRVFGNSGITDYSDAPILQRFTRAAPTKPTLSKQHYGLKSLFRPAPVVRIGPHRPKLDTDHLEGRRATMWRNGAGHDVTEHLLQGGWTANADVLSYSLCQVNHYVIRSIEIFALQNLNDPPIGNDQPPMGLTDFSVFNTNHSCDDSICRWTDQTSAVKEQLRALPNVEAAHLACVAIYQQMIKEMRDVAKTDPDSDVAQLLDSTRMNETTTLEPEIKMPERDPDDMAPRWLADLRRSDYRRGWYFSDETYAAQFTHRSTDTLICSFDNLSNVKDPALTREPWGYSFYRAEGWSHMGVMAFEKNWYRDEGLFDFLEERAKAGFFRQFKNVVLTGTSMGAYAATAFAKLIPGCTVLAFSPQSTLDKKLVPWEERFGSGRKRDWSGRYRDATLDCAAAAAVFVVYDPYFEPDKRHAERYQGPNVYHLKSWYSAHKSALFMRRADILKDLMVAAVDGTLDEAKFYQLIRSRRDLIWYYNGLADHLIGAGHLQLARQLSKHLGRLGRPGIAQDILTRVEQGD